MIINNNIGGIQNFSYSNQILSKNSKKAAAVQNVTNYANLPADSSLYGAYSKVSFRGRNYSNDLREKLIKTAQAETGQIKTGDLEQDSTKEAKFYRTKK